MNPALSKFIALALVTIMVSACGSLTRSRYNDGKSPSLAEQINIRRDKH